MSCPGGCVGCSQSWSGISSSGIRAIGHGSIVLCALLDDKWPYILVDMDTFLTDLGFETPLLLPKIPASVLEEKPMVSKRSEPISPSAQLDSRIRWSV